MGLNDGIKAFLAKHESFTKDLIRAYYEQSGEVLTGNALKMRISRLIRQGVIAKVGRGIYKTGSGLSFRPPVSNQLKALVALIEERFPMLTYSVWSTAWLNDFTTLQLMRKLLVIEVESSSLDGVFQALKESSFEKVFVEPDESAFVNYIADLNDAVIIKSLISESPLFRVADVPVPRIEKLLVDLHSDKLWLLIFGSEKANIFAEVSSNYDLNYSTLLKYASRRNKRNEIWKYIKSTGVLDPKVIKMIDR